MLSLINRAVWLLALVMVAFAVWFPDWSLDRWFPAGQTLSFFFFSGFSNPQSPLPKGWSAGRLVAQDRVIVIAETRGVIDEGEVPRGWHRVATVELQASGLKDMGGEVVDKDIRTIIASSVEDSNERLAGHPGARHELHEMRELVCFYLRIKDRDSTKPAEVEEERYNALFALHIKAFAAEESYAEGSDSGPEELDASLAPAGEQPEAEPRRADVVLRLPGTSPIAFDYRVDDGTGRFLLHLGDSDDQAEIPADLIGLLAKARAEHFHSPLAERRAEVRELENRILTALTTTDLIELTVATGLSNDLLTTRNELGQVEDEVRQAASAVDRAVPRSRVTNAEATRLTALAEDLHTQADLLRAEARDLAQLAAPLVAETRAKRESIEAGQARKRTDRVVLLATIGAIVLGAPALVASFFGASVRPLDDSSPVRFADLVVHSTAVAMAVSALALVLLYRPEHGPTHRTWAWRTLVCLLAPALNFVWSLDWDSLRRPSTWLTEVVASPGEAGVLCAFIIAAIATLVIAQYADRRDPPSNSLSLGHG